MTLKIIGSSSEGNGYILETESEALVMEAGCRLQDILEAIDHNLQKIQGCIITHEHGDHAKHAKHYQQRGIRIMASKGTIEKIGTDGRILKAEQPYRTGGFTIIPFIVAHDAAEPFGYLIHHQEMGTALFATDTVRIDYDFEGLNNILIEANYSDDIADERIREGKLRAYQHRRTEQSHMSLETCRRTLRGLDLSQVNNIVLIHLSDGNSNAEEFRRTIEAATGRLVHIADRGIIIPFNKTPF